ncbi:TAXI family TRAP transporter solute-binding subunit [Pseudothauera lacus]|uniref:C4-dicarboxylate ABC transporter n=1 Tax=Pseudothauera lacus TaxID=2136175 RepID=A0A2T4ICH6_9RHOO|nr:TAXI family TRAP transporter solute-binding subunit [Pseudothauera lacus]PTD95473.1 C4-dicarboxylate ABC transporter [Pseudothauera lacus]
MKLIRTLGLAAALVAAGAAHAQQQFVTVLTGGTSGVYYPLGVALTKVYGDNIPGIRATVQSTKASAENLNLLQAGRGEVAFALGDAVSDAWTGNEEAGFRTKLDKLRGLAGIYENYIQIVASADSGIRTLADLRGKRVSVGAPRSGTELNARAIFRGAGMSYSDLGKVEYLPFGESVELIKNRQLDATLQSAGLGVASIRDLANSVNIVVIPVPAEVVAAIGDAAYQPAVIPANTYQGQSTDIATAAIRNILVTHSGVPENTVYAMTKSMFENLDQMVAAHAAARGIQAAGAADNLPLPLHPGAERYYREAGLLK